MVLICEIMLSKGMIKRSTFSTPLLNVFIKLDPTSTNASNQYKDGSIATIKLVLIAN
uniref:Uncharacterized protein n=1 Tax=Physcomitrium patens TaxID=3218 RepID=A0A2K1ISQ1_PHYPA|nr:hypothetical protein PHYPA_026430 [Physcomitrium patens]